LAFFSSFACLLVLLRHPSLSTLHTRVLQGWNELCRIEGFDRGEVVSELKASIEAEAGLVPALTRLSTPRASSSCKTTWRSAEDAGMPSEQALAIQLYAQKIY
jgi:hypothetical protein